MPITQELLAKRLKEERTRLEFTQEEVADRLGLKRPTIAQIEGGHRAVTGIELAQFAAIYKRGIEHFLAEPNEQEDAGVVLLRANADLSEPDLEELEKCIAACRAITTLERSLGRQQVDVSFSYSLERPQSRWEAVEQGMRLADVERKRLGLGALPVRNIVEIISRHGVRVGKYTLTSDVSGMFFIGPDTGKVIMVNAGHAATRQLFSYAHEYAHLLVDSAHSAAGISRFDTRNDLIEVRANAFAAHFLMPDEGVRNFLDGLGGPSRQVMEVFNGYKQEEQGLELLLVQRRATPGSQDVKMMDVLRMARHFGTSYAAALYHLLNLKIVSKENFDKLLNEQSQANKIVDTLDEPTLKFKVEQENVAELKKVAANLIIEAVLLEVIGVQKAYEYGRLVDLYEAQIDELLKVGE